MTATRCLSPRRSRWSGALLALCGAFALPGCNASSDGAASAGPADPIEIKVVVVTAFERGEDTGDAPGELQLWAERWPLRETVDFPQGHRPLRTDGQGVLGIVTGVGTARAAASIMALGMDPRFDLTNAYWLVAGIAGMDPEDGTLGSAAWARFVVDGDLAHEIDIREAPTEWDTGYVPLRKSTPYEMPLQEDLEGAVYELDEGLAAWAYELTRNVELPDSEQLQGARAPYSKYPAALEAPRVMRGDNLAAMTFWHGALLNDWANDWMRYFTDGRAEFTTSAMEETGTLQSLTFLDRAGRVDLDRVMVLRSGSNFTLQGDGSTAAQSLAGEKKGDYSAYLPSLEALWLAGRVVVSELLEGWSDYRDTPPSAAP